MENEFKVGMLVIDSDGQVILVTNDNLRVINKYKSDFAEIEYYLYDKKVKNVFPVEDRDTFRIYDQNRDSWSTFTVNRELSTVIDGNQYYDYTEHSSNGDGVVCFYKNGYLHNEDGPAFIGETETYYLDGVYHTKEDWELDTGKVPELTLDEVEDRLGYKIKLKKDE
jgi:hypothetical protein